MSSSFFYCQDHCPGKNEAGLLTDLSPNCSTNIPFWLSKMTSDEGSID